MEPSRDPAKRRPRLFLALTWICVVAIFGFFLFRIARAGVDVREGFWVYWENNRFYNDSNAALHHGQHVLREAMDLEREDQAKSATEPDAKLPTIAKPGVGLFDSPCTPAIVIQRWHTLKPVYVHIFRGWVATYDNLVRDEAGGDYQMDYPPLRSLVMTLWAWKVQAQYPSINQFPREPTLLINPFTHKRQNVTPDIVHPLLMCNMTMEAISAIAMFLLVWIWVRRGEPDTLTTTHWRMRWGDPLLLAPPILLGMFTLIRPWFTFQLAGISATTSLIDERITSVGWWIFMLLRFMSAVSLARILPRPFRGLACGVVAGSFTWLNPATILVSFGWPQWEAWLLPFFLVSAALVSVNWWLTAGLVLGVGCMFKGQLFLIAPILLLCPLLAGWFGRFMRIVAGYFTGFGLIVWPWLITNTRSEAYIVAAVFAGSMICITSIYRAAVWNEIRRFAVLVHNGIRRRETATPTQSEFHWVHWIAIGVAMITAIWLSLLVYRSQDPSLHKWTLLLLATILTLPWFIPRRHISGWLTAVFAASYWLAAFSLNGSFSWWNVGFMYGTQKHQSMQLGGESLSNLSSLLARRYGWDLHDAVATWHVPFMVTPIDLDVQSALATLFEITLLICTIGAAIHLRRNDKKFLVALVAPWLLFVTLLTQMAARYTVYPAIMSAALIGVSVEMSLLQVLLITLSCAMLGNQLLDFSPQTAAIAYSMTSRTFPDIGWLMLLLVAVFVFTAIAPSRSRTLKIYC